MRIQVESRLLGEEAEAVYIFTITAEILVRSLANFYCQ